ncbi:TetR/AcrR family transcriptional regulator [Candidatus Albibeggiatoa sp. nov. BB20]|uniref:TetR/AcrR family transcriptional regulator n=1 Tax=Candidatus Albibeggiatoa sp. nov. BB20 TaxID=3162723 RepID=UPI0033657D3A
MARIQFDRNDIIDKSIQLFWQHGFSASSMQQVVKITGLKPGSIYLAFGNKEGLFREALNSYAQKAIVQIRKTLDSAPSVGEGICILFEQIIQESTRENYCSCFLIKTQLELAAEGNKLHELASDKLEEVEVLFQNYLEKEFGKIESQQRAVSLMLHIFGLRIYGYRQGSVNSMRQGVRAGLPWLPWSDI